MKNIAFILLSIFTVLAAILVIPENRIAHSTDYDPYLNEEHLQKSQKELGSRIEFWEQKLDAAPGNFVFQKKLAGLYAAGFKLSGDISQLRRSDSLLQQINKRLPGQVGVLQSLAANAVTRHAFRESESYIREAFGIGQNKFASSLMLADVMLERGNLLEAELLLRDIASRSHFDYLIREVKLHDQADELDEAVRCMEKAADLAKASGDAAVINWSLSNLADMYGHQGKVKKSYGTYLEALHYNPADLHALKGIAWIAFSQDKNTGEARRILNFLQSIHPVPDYDLLLAEIAAYEQDKSTEEKYKKQFIAEASKAQYGNMYKSYLCQLKSDEGEAAEAWQIARQDVKERPHPMSYQLLAWAAYRKGNKAEALDIMEKHVIGQTGEPKALYHAGVILRENGRKEDANMQLNAALDASFELGPVVAKEIETQLSRL